MPIFDEVVDGTMHQSIRVATTVLSLVLVAHSEGYLTGTVKSPDGKPLAGVSVSDDRKEFTKTDSQGAFRIKRTQPVFFFSLSGYEPLAAVPSKDQTELNVVIAESVGRTWIVPDCKDKTSQSPGLRLRFTIPKDAKIKVVASSDYEKRIVWRPHGKKKEWLALWKGGTVSMGHPIPNDFLEAASFQERSMSWQGAGELGGGGAEDARGVMKSGGLWRWAGSSGRLPFIVMSRQRLQPISTKSLTACATKAIQQLMRAEHPSLRFVVASPCDN